MSWDGMKHRQVIERVQTVNWYAFRTTGSTLWKDVGDKAADIGDRLDRAKKTLLDPDQGGWTGKAADAFGEEVDKIVQYAEDLSRALSGAEDSSQEQVLLQAAEQICDFLDLNRDGSQKAVQYDARKLPMPEWEDPDMPGRIGVYHAWNNNGWTLGIDENDHKYFAYDKKTAGDHGYTDGEDEARGGKVSRASGQAPADELSQEQWRAFLGTHGGGASDKGDGNETLWPANSGKWPEIFEAWDVNKFSKQKCIDTAGQLGDYLNQIPWTQPPPTPQFAVAADAGADTAGTGGGGTGGGFGGGNGTGGTGGTGGTDGTDIDPPVPPRPPQPEPPVLKPPGEDPPICQPPPDLEPPVLKPPGEDPPICEPPPDLEKPVLRPPIDTRPPEPPTGGGWVPPVRTMPDEVDLGADTARAGGVGGGAGGAGFGGGGIGGAGAGAGGFGAGGPGAGVAGPGMAGAGTGAAAAGAGAAGLGAGSTGTTGGMMPMMGGMGGGMGQQGEGQDQQRTTWLEEDEDVWGADDDSPGPVIGG